MNTASQLERQRVTSYRSALGAGLLPTIHWVPEGTLAACDAVVAGDIIDWREDETSPWPFAVICKACALAAANRRAPLIF